MMKIYKITELAKIFNMARSSLLYYDRIGLLSPAHRSSAGYRLYTEDDVEKLRIICCYRNAGLTLDEIKEYTDTKNKKKGILILENRLKELQTEMQQLRIKQATLCSLIKTIDSCKTTFVNKEMWVQMLCNSGMSDKDMHHWHAQFEKNAPDAHEAFLQWLGIRPDEILTIRKWSQQI